MICRRARRCRRQPLFQRHAWLFSQVYDWVDGGRLRGRNYFSIFKGRRHKTRKFGHEWLPWDSNQCVSPDTTDRIHLNEKEYNEPNDSSYIHTVLSMLPRSTRFTQASSSFQLMKDTKKAGKKYLINPNIKDTDCVVVRLGYLVKNLRMKRRSYWNEGKKISAQCTVWAKPLSVTPQMKNK